MSTISAYDLLADYSTAASYASTTSTTSTSDSTSSSFTDMMLATASEEEETTDVVEADLATVEEDSDGDSSDADSDDSTSSTTTTTTTANDLYTRPDTYEADTPSDELSFMDMLQLMIAQFQNQTIENTASTTDMMNQLTQMTTMQAMTSMESSITEMTATNAMLYNSQLVGKEVTVAYYDDQGNFVEEVGIVAASGYYDGVPVIFFEGQTSFHAVSSIMAIGRLPEGALDDDDTTVDPDTEGDDSTVDPDADVDGDDSSADGTEGADVDNTTGEGSSEATDGTDSDVDSISYNTDYVDYSSMTPEELLEASKNALG